ncbi:endo-1,4-beta-xylanase [Paenibacillus mucilaginosus]|uniref:Beta-xylanase n=1 Tax=Paenibacillus mucilaginosus (strain KNP414) TaxID=1036673 RepID=F8F7P4_PAEMK|nr:endo-1,4-beta-xylanase [Paenibacillus mucilaginosus]AEI39529.1 endo-1,4-beta-xylanase [Paenibacillus mucilaginosus KNP414]MCG7214651.1 endo-1,4-beta-xylanase [Paenibacillus mucilaginosus]WDM28488.1 endo-1,4-beta-xylanase [Paenibacillus mucilaginosus]
MKRTWNIAVTSLLTINLLAAASFADFTASTAMAATAVKSSAATSSVAKTSNKKEQKAVTLKEAAQAKGKHIGVATQSWLVNKSEYAAVLNQEFDTITPEYQMKMGVIQKQKGIYNFSEADALVDFALKNNKIVRGHTLVWHSSLPSWVENGKFTREEWIAILKDHITKTVQHFKGKVYGWDVVNEAFWQNGQYRPTVWYNNIGPEYIEMAFRFAHEADPQAKLYYNDFSSEVKNEKSDAIYKMLKDLKSKGVPIDGIGFQTHLTIDGLNYNDMKTNFQRFAALGLDTDITEMDLVTHTFQGTMEQKMNAAAAVYGNVMKVALSLPSCKFFIAWGLNDSQSWLNEDTGFSEYPLLFDDSFGKKPAYNAVMEQLRK